jgi:hypothetical protein
MKLGRVMYARSVVLVGALTSENWKGLLTTVIGAMKMTKVTDEPVVFDYPVDGKGGTGQTMMQPITESFVVLDTWPDHDGAYLFIASCREYDRRELYPVFMHFGLRVNHEHAYTMEIP